MPVIGEAWIPVKPDLSGFGKDVDRQTSGAMGSIKSFAKTAALTFAGAFAVSKGIDFLKGTISAASDLNETVSKTRTIFGPASAGLEKWASTAAKSFGQSRQQALDAASTFGNLFVQLGVGSDEAAKMSTQMVELASDFASFHNADPTEVINAQTAAFRGEYDALQRFVPTINAATVEQEALAATGKTATSELTAQEKALAVQTLMMKGAGDATGDFARTSDSLANKQRIASAQWSDMTAKIGGALLPVMTKAMGFISGTVIPVVGKVGEIAGQAFNILFKSDFTGGPLAEDSWLVDKLFDIREGIETVMGIAKQAFNILFKGDFTGGPFAEDSSFVDGLFQVRELLERVFGFIRDNAQPILAGLGVAFALVTAPITSVVAGLVLAYTHFEGFRNIVDTVVRFLTDQVIPRIVDFAGYIATEFGHLVEWVRQHWAAIQEAISHVINVVAGIIRTVIDAIAATWRAWGDDLLRMATTAWDFIRESIENAINLVRSVIETVLAVINGDWGAAWNAIKGIAAAVWDQIHNIVSTAINLVKSVIGGVMSAIGGIWSGAWDHIKGFLDGIWQAIKDATFAALGVLVQWFTELPGRIVGTVQAAAGALQSLGKWVVEKIVEGVVFLANAAGGLFAWFRGLPDKLWGVVTAAAESMRSIGKKLVEFIIEGIGSMAGAIGSAVTGILPDSIAGIDMPWGDGPGAVPAGGGRGSAGGMARNAVARFGGRITSSYRDPGRNARAGGSPTSYHLDRANPAHDIVGPNMRGMFDWLYRTYGSSIREMIYGNRMVKNGRLMPYRPNDHWDHVHIAHEGGYVTAQGIAPLRSDELMTKLQVGETVLPKDFEGAGVIDPDDWGRKAARAYAQEMRRLARAV